jgi:hypothetical protein
LILITKIFAKIKQDFLNIKVSTSQEKQKTDIINNLIEFTTLYIFKLLTGKNAKTLKDKVFFIYLKLIKQHQNVINKFSSFSNFLVKCELVHVFCKEFGILIHLFETLAEKNTFICPKFFIFFIVLLWKLLLFSGLMR